ncbi:hypothetical protein RHMOL_Rhmol08G0020800 [Rhododendron molle]|uniref:Uncharacterized protein n=1 Tax=Rhododendron molle TaxID=49168 RepID=A0ACC0MK06_RHOML|nr:hypothetical protein RHMOL_Rhmol08G0020800 [Rhododendron molle]
MEDTHFSTLGQDPETQISDPSIATAFDWDKPFNEENQESPMDEDEESSTDHMGDFDIICGVGGEAPVVRSRYGRGGPVTLWSFMVRFRWIRDISKPVKQGDWVSLSDYEV